MDDIDSGSSTGSLHSFFIHRSSSTNFRFKFSDIEPTNQCNCYSLPQGSMDQYEVEMDAWLEDQLVEEEYQASIEAIFLSWLLPDIGQEGGASRPSKSPNIDRERRAGDERIWKDYFSADPIYTDLQFRRRFRMRRELFLRILERVVAADSYFQQKCDAIGMTGLSSIQKVTCALRMLAYGTAADSLDEYIRIAESTALKCLNRFCIAIVDMYSSEYLRSPTVDDVQRILTFNQQRGFPGMMGSIDCMHMPWKNCPRAWKGQFSGKSKKPTIVLEAVASYDLWIWHAFFGMPGSMNDINVLDRSNVFSRQIDGVAPKASFQVNQKTYNHTYLLADGIYPSWGSFVQMISDPQGEKRKHFAKMQESCRKDIERAFGVLQARWAIIKVPARSWSPDNLNLIMTTCIILHNLIIEDERGRDFFDESWYDDAHVEVVRGATVRDSRLPSIIRNRRLLRDEDRYNELRGDLIEHLWQKRGNM